MTDKKEPTLADKLRAISDQARLAFPEKTDELLDAVGLEQEAKKGRYKIDIEVRFACDIFDIDDIDEFDSELFKELEKRGFSVSLSPKGQYIVLTWGPKCKMN